MKNFKEQLRFFIVLILIIGVLGSTTFFLGGLDTEDTDIESSVSPDIDKGNAENDSTEQSPGASETDLRIYNFNSSTKLIKHDSCYYSSTGNVFVANEAMCCYQYNVEDSFYFYIDGISLGLNQFIVTVKSSDGCTIYKMENGDLPTFDEPAFVNSGDIIYVSIYSKGYPIEDLRILLSKEDFSPDVPRDPVNFSDKTMVCIGDSITYGYYYDGVAEESQLETPWCETVGDLLGLKTVVNEGIGGSTLCNGDRSRFPMCDRIADFEYDADIITLLGGTNDFNRCYELGTIDSTDTNTIYGALNTIAQILIEKYPDAYILFMTPLPYYSTPTNEVGVSQADIAIAVGAIADKYGFDLLDLRHHNAGFNFLDAWYTTNDFMHPSQAYSTELLAPLIAEFIQKNYS